MEDLSFKTAEWEHQLNMLTNLQTPDQRSKILHTLSQQKTSAELLNKLAASRQHKRRPLPGVGHPYWKTAKDHLQLSKIPPQININMKPVMILSTEPIPRMIVELLKETWKYKPGSKFGCKYDQYTSHINNVANKEFKKHPCISHSSHQAR